jgi:hypothetical protein
MLTAVAVTARGPESGTGTRICGIPAAAGGPTLELGVVSGR